MKKRAKRAARKSPSKFQGAVELARERWQAAKKSAKGAKHAAKQARRQFKDAKKAVKRAKEEMLAAARKLQSSVMGAARRRSKARVKTARKKAAPTAPPRLVRLRLLRPRLVRRPNGPREGTGKTGCRGSRVDGRSGVDEPRAAGDADRIVGICMSLL